MTEFMGNLKHYSVNLKMKDYGPLEISVEDKHSFERWSRTIDKQFINGQDSIFRDTFYSAKRLFNFLTQNFNKVIIKNGSLAFEYGVIDNKPISVRIELVKQQIQKNQLAERKISRLQKQLIQANKTNSRNKLCKCAFLCLIVFVFVLTHYYGQRQREELLQRLKRIKNEYKTNISHQQELVLNQMKIADSQSKEIKRLSGQLFRISIDNHPDNPHQDYFLVTPTSPTSAKIQKINSGGWHNFVNKFAIRSQIGEARYKIVLSYLRQSVRIGFTTSKGFGVLNNQRNAESVYYRNHENGYIYQQGKVRQLTDAGADVGDTIEVVVDFVTNKFEWLKEGIKIAECSIPASMKDKSIYLSIITSSIDNEVEVFS